MVVWSDDLDDIVPTCKDFEDRLIKLLWRSRPAPLPLSSVSSYPTTATGSVSGHGPSRNSVTPSDLVAANEKLIHADEKRGTSSVASAGGARTTRRDSSGLLISGGDLEKGEGDGEEEEVVDEKGKRGLFGRKKKAKKGQDRPVRLFAPVYNGFAAALSICE